MFDELLRQLLELTGSVYGFIGEALTNAKGAKYLKTIAITDISWNEDTHQLYEKGASAGLEFHNLGTLFGAVVAEGLPVISNAPAADPRRGGLPEGHPLLNAFLGLPFFAGDDLIGMVGVANRPGGYNADVAKFLDPLLVT